MKDEQEGEVKENQGGRRNNAAAAADAADDAGWEEATGFKSKRKFKKKQGLLQAITKSKSSSDNSEDTDDGFQTVGFKPVKGSGEGAADAGAHARAGARRCARGAQ